MTINIEKIISEEKAKDYKAEVEAQTKTEELSMEDTNKKWDAMVSICLNAAKKVLGERLKPNNLTGTKMRRLLNYQKNRRK